VAELYSVADVLPSDLADQGEDGIERDEVDEDAVDDGSDE
jgi:hypothetical protein